MVRVNDVVGVAQASKSYSYYSFSMELERAKNFVQSNQVMGWAWPKPSRLVGRDPRPGFVTPPSFLAQRTVLPDFTEMYTLFFFTEFYLVFT